LGRESERGGRDGGRRRVIVMRLGGSSSAIGANDSVRCPPEASTESEGQHCILNRSEGGIQPVDDHEWGERKTSHQGKTTEDEQEEHDCEYNVEDLFVCQFGRDGISIGGGGGSRGPGKLLGNNWDGHRGEGNDDDKQIEARPEERFGEPLSEGHDLVVLVVFEVKRVREGEPSGAKNLAPIFGSLVPRLCTVHRGRVALQKWKALA